MLQKYALLSYVPNISGTFSFKAEVLIYYKKESVFGFITATIIKFAIKFRFI